MFEGKTARFLLLVISVDPQNRPSRPRAIVCKLPAERKYAMAQVPLPDCDPAFYTTRPRGRTQLEMKQIEVLSACPVYIQQPN